MPIDRQGYKKSKDESSYLSLEVGGSAHVRLLNVTEGISPAESRVNDGSDITEPNRWMKYPHRMLVVVLGEEGNIKDIPLERELIWEGLNTGAWKILNRWINGTIPDHPTYGKNTCVINRTGEKDYEVEWFEDPTQDEDERDPEFSKYG